MSTTAELPALAPVRCRTHVVEEMRVVADACSHVAEQSRFGKALVCDTCGMAAHSWRGHACGRRRPTQQEIADERAACPIWPRLLEQKSQEVSAS